MISQIPEGQKPRPLPPTPSPSKKQKLELPVSIVNQIKSNDSSDPKAISSVKPYNPEFHQEELKAMASDPQVQLFQEEEFDLDRANIDSAHNWAKTNIPESMKRIRTLKESIKPLGEAMETSDDLFREPLENLENHSDSAAQDIKMTHVDNVVGDISGLTAGVNIISTLGNGANLILGHTLLSQAQEERDRLALELGADNEGVKKLDDFIEKKKKKLAASDESFIVDTVLMTPKAGRFVLNYIPHISSLASSIVGWVATGAGIISSGLEVLRATAALVKTKMAGRALKEEIKGQIAVNKGEIGRDGVKQDILMRAKVDGIETPIDALLKRKKEERDQKHTEFTSKYEPLIKSKTLSFSETLKSLQALGIDTDLIHLREELEQPLANQLYEALSETNVDKLRSVLGDDKVKDLLFQRYFGRKEGFAKVGMDVLKNLINKKQKIDKFFDKLRLTKANINFSLATVCAGILVVAKVLAVTTAIAIPTIAISATGFGAIGVGVILIGVGLYYLYSKKPNLFRAMAKSTHIRLALKNIPLAIRSFQHKRNEVKKIEYGMLIEKIQEMQGSLRAIVEGKPPQNLELLPKELRSFYKKIKKELNHLNHEGSSIQDKMTAIQFLIEKELNKCNAKMEDVLVDLKDTEEKMIYWQNQVKELQDTLTTANYKDFLLTVRGAYHSKLRSHKKNVHESNLEEIYNASKQNRQPQIVNTSYFNKLRDFRISDIVTDLAHALLYDPSMLSDDDNYFITKVLNIKIDEFQKVPNKAEAEQQLIASLKEILGGDEDRVRGLNEKILNREEIKRSQKYPLSLS